MALPARKLRQIPPARPALRPVRPKRRPARRGDQPEKTAWRTGRRTPFVLFSLAVVTVMIVSLASAQAMVAQEAFRVADLTRSVEALEESHGRLRLKVAEMSSPGRLVRAARRAGLMLPDPDRVEILEIDPARPGPGTGGTDEGAGGVPLPGSGEGSGPVLAQGPGGPAGSGGEG